MSILSKNLISFIGPWDVPVEIRCSALLLPAFFMWINWGNVGLLGNLFFCAVVFLSILLHEWGHAWGCVVQGVPTHRIVVHTIGGYCEFDPRNVTIPQAELIVGMGPIVNLALWAVAGLLSNFDLSETTLWGLGIIGMINLFLALFNLLPTMPTDGGQLLRVVLMRLMPEPVATRICGFIGLLIALALIPFFILLSVTIMFPIFYWVPLRRHWRMLRHAEMKPRYSPTKRRFWQWRRRPEGPWDRLPAPVPV